MRSTPMPGMLMRRVALVRIMRWTPEQRVRSRISWNPVTGPANKTDFLNPSVRAQFRLLAAPIVQQADPLGGCRSPYPRDKACYGRAKGKHDGPHRACEQQLRTQLRSLLWPPVN